MIDLSTAAFFLLIGHSFTASTRFEDKGKIDLKQPWSAEFQLDFFSIFVKTKFYKVWSKIKRKYMHFFETQHIVKKYANQLALNDVSISVSQGTVFGLLGPNGAGKTSLIRIINQITAPDSGEVFFDGRKLEASHVRKIGYLPEERGLYKKMYVGEQALYLAQLKGMSRGDALKKLKYWFDKFEIHSWWDRKVEELSKGMQQKIQFIITVLHEPELLIFDEPFSGFDPINANLLKEEILNLKAKGATIIFSTHNMSSVEEICDNIALINKSEKILDGQISEIKERYKQNLYEVCFKGSFNKFQASMTASYEIISISQFDKQVKVGVRLLGETSTNDFLASMLQCGEVSSFKEILPSMNEIFIRVVDQWNGNTIINN